MIETVCYGINNLIFHGLGHCKITDWKEITLIR